jgi:hypothetical protein
MISEICKQADARDPDRTKVQDMHDQCKEVMSNGERCDCYCHVIKYRRTKAGPLRTLRTKVFDLNI